MLTLLAWRSLRQHPARAAVTVLGIVAGVAGLRALDLGTAGAFASVDRKLVEASWCLGISRVSTFRRIVAPLSVPGIATGAILSFAHTLGEFGVVLMVGGNIAGVTRTVSISIYDQVQALDYRAATETSLLLLAASFVVLAVTYALQRRVWALWPTS